MSAIFSITLGYLLGCLSPARWISKAKNVDLAASGTGNLGATNTAYVLGKRTGIRVLILDMAKSFFSYKLAKLMFPQLMVAGILASIGAIAGHCFPVFYHFQGGKGLAAFAGLVLAYDFGYFLIILFSGSLLMLLLDTGVAATVLGSVLFPVLVYLKNYCLPEAMTAAVVSVLILFTHRDNIRMALEHRDEVRPREFFWGNSK